MSVIRYAEKRTHFPNQWDNLKENAYSDLPTCWTIPNFRRLVPLNKCFAIPAHPEITTLTPTAPQTDLNPNVSVQPSMNIYDTTDDRITDHCTTSMALLRTISNL